MSGSHRSRASAGRHRAPQAPLGERLLPGGGARALALGGVTAGTLSVAAGALLPGLGTAAFAVGDGGDTAGSAPAAATVAVAVPAGAPFAAPSATDLARLRGCESAGRYATATGNGYYGAYQFDLATWRSLGLDGSPDRAEPPLQDAAANALEQTRGWRPWPSCSSQLGLVPHRAHGMPASQIIATLDPTVAGTPTTLDGTPAPVLAVKAPGGRSGVATGSGPTSLATPPAPSFATDAPPFPGRVLTVGSGATYRSDVRLWQERMAARGWSLAADGYFGLRSQAVARAFAAEKHISDGLPGEVGARVWRAAWESPLAD